MSFVPSIERHGEVDNTMILARERAAKGAPTGTFVVAETQRTGRGRLGRAWFSPAGAGLWTTAIFRPPPRPDGSPLSLVGLVMGLAALDAARERGAVQAMLKWPNDVIVGERKLCGILVEAEDVLGATPLVLVGFGLNLARSVDLSLPDDLAGRYIGLAEAVGKPGAEAVDPALSALVGAVGRWYDRWTGIGARPVLEAWSKVDALRGSEVRAEAPAGPVVGKADGVTESGALRVVTKKGVVEVAAGEVKRVRPGV